MRRGLVVLALVMCSIGVAGREAAATVRPQPVRLRMVDPPVLRPGAETRLEFELRAARGVEISGVTAESPELTEGPARGSERRALARGEAMRFVVTLRPARTPSPLRVRYRVDGVPEEREVDLRALMEEERGRRSALAQKRPGTTGPEPGGLVPFTADAEAAESPEAERDPQGWNRAITVRGRLAYYREDGVEMPAHGVGVKVLDWDPNLDDELASGTTGADGGFELTFNWTDQILDGDPDLYVKFETQTYAVTVQSSLFEIEYSYQYGYRNNFTGTLWDTGTLIPTSTDVQGALHIHTNFYRSYFWFQNAAGGYPPFDVDVQWPDGDTGAYYDPLFQTVHLGRDRTWREDTHAHEHGHHWMDGHGVLQAMDYCNSECDDGPGCGHCTWCPEDEVIAYQEGFADWVADVFTREVGAIYGQAPLYMRRRESIESCDGAWSTDKVPQVEGLVAAALTDLEDPLQDIDPNRWPGTRDTLSLGTLPIFDAVRLGDPLGPVELMEQLAVQMPQLRERIWRTVGNARWNLDSLKPAAPANFRSTSHTVGTLSTDITVTLMWDTAVDDWSGIGSYELTLDRPGATPDTLLVLPNGNAAITYPLPPGTYNFFLRGRDRSGRLGSASIIGPYEIGTPEPADLVTTTPSGWFGPVVPRPDNSATTSSVPKPVTLAGNSATTYLNHAYMNDGDFAPMWSAPSRLLIDGSLVGLSLNLLPGPRQVGRAVNVGPFTVRGGRHTAGIWLDYLENWFEAREDNNLYGRPWIWQPVSIPAFGRLRRAAPPAPTDGWWTLGAGSSFWPTCDGLRFNAPPGYAAVWLAADDDTSDHDLRLHWTTTSVDTGFAAAVTSSMRGPGEVDLVLVNRHQVSQVAWDLGVSQGVGGAAGYVARHCPMTATLAMGDSFTVSLPDSEFVIVMQANVPGGSAPALLKVRALAGAGPYRAGWLSPTMRFGGLSDGSIVTYASDDSGYVQLPLLSGSSLPTGILVVRDPADGRVPATYTFRLTGMPPDVAAQLTPGFSSFAAPVYPRNAPFSPVDGFLLPDSLHGDSATTFVIGLTSNVGTVMVPSSFQSQTRLDGVTLRSYDVTPGLAAGSTALHLPSAAVAVRGGRHTLSLVTDPPGSVPDLDPRNDRWAEQFVWSPRVMVEDVPLTRPAPPDRTGGWADLRSGAPLYFNCDGLRTPMVTSVPGTWLAVSLMPGAASDVDLQLHSPRPGIRDGFAEARSVSAWGPGESEYVLVRLDGTSERVFDVGAVKVSGGEDYTAEVGRALPVALPVDGRIGPLALGANRTLGVVVVNLPAGSYRARIEDLSGGVDWGLAVHAPDSTHQSKSAASAMAWLEGPDVPEEVLFQASGSGAHAFAVWKVSRASLASAGQYTLRIESTTLPVPSSFEATALRLAAENPMRGRGSVTYSLPADTEARVEIFDIHGARVRTLVSERQRAGRHRVEWNGFSDEGRPLPAGLYLARLTAGQERRTQRIVKLD